jgi:lipid A 3-O-deacylase
MAGLAFGPGIFILASTFGAYPLIDAPHERISELGIDRLEPTKDDRRITTTNLQVYFLQKRYEPLRLKVRLGAMLTRPTGAITQLFGTWEEGTLHSETLASSAWGAGPSAEARFELLRGERATLNVDLGTALLLYDRPFPAGGDHYNGMFQLGPSVSFTPAPAHTLTLGYRWVHVSNGQGLGPHNPAYEAKGLTLRYQLAL